MVLSNGRLLSNKSGSIKDLTHPNHRQYRRGVPEVPMHKLDSKS